MAGKAQSARQRSAAANLRAAGIKSDGRAPYTQWRALSASQRADAIAARAKVDTSYRAGGSQAWITAGQPRGPRRTVELPGVRIVQTGSQAVTLAEVRAAAARGDGVVIRATFKDSGGQWRTRRLDSPRTLGIGRALAASGDGAEGPPGRVSAWTPGTPRGAQLIEIQAHASGEGMDADDLRRMLDDFGVWEAIAAMWEAEGIYG